MEEEYIYSGYCRQIDASRMVTVETDGRQITDIGCGYSRCPHKAECRIACQIRQLEE